MPRIVIYYLIVGVVLSFSDVLGQDQHIADSLIQLYNARKNGTDSIDLALLDNIAYNHSNPDSALFYSELLLKEATKRSKPEYIYKGLIHKGNALRLQGKLSEAIKVFISSIEEAESTGNKKGIGSSYITLGDVYFYANDIKNSLRYYNKAMSIFKDLNDSNLLANVYFNAGSEYLHIGMIDSALNYFGFTTKIYKTLDHKSGIAYSIGNIGLAYSRLKNYDQAEKNLLKAIKLLKELGDMYPVASYQIGLARIYKTEGKIKTAIDYAQRSYNLSVKYGLTQQLRDACEELSDLYRLTGNYKKAFEYQIKYISYRDSIINREKIMQMADMRTEFEVSQKQAEVDLLKKKRQAQTVISAGLVLVILMAVALVFLLYSNNRRKQKLNRQLAEQKEELETQRDQLTELNQTKDRFFSIISHDLRGPISTLHGFSVILKECITNGNIVTLSEMSEELNITINKVSSLLDNLLDWALSQQGRFPYSPEKIDLSGLMNDVVMNSSPMALAKNINIVNEVRKGLLLWADRNSLMTLFRNLLNNAIKFSHKNSSVEIRAGISGNEAEIIIADNGVGIPEDKHNDIFKLKGDKSTWGTEREKGVGLGLSLAYDFVTMNKGTIEVESEVDKGTTFTVKIPLYKK